MQNNINRSPLLEITIISAQGLKKASCACSHRLRPFVIVNASTTNSSKCMKTYKTSVDDKGGVNPIWGDKFYLSLDQTFFYQRSCPGIYLQLYTKHLLMGKTHLGWCCIPAGDIANRLSPVGSTRFLSYGVRDKDGTRGHGVVNVAIRLDSSFNMIHSSRVLVSDLQQWTEMGESDHNAIGIPVIS